MLENSHATATGDLLQQDLCYGATSGVELEMLEGRADMAPSLAFHHMAFHHMAAFSSHI